MTLIKPSRFQLMVAEFDRLIGAKPNKDLRVRLIQEEAQELIDAVKNQDMVETIDGMCDLLYVTYGAADVFEVELNTPSEDDYDIPTHREDVDWCALHIAMDDGAFNASVSEAVKAIRTGKQQNIRMCLSELADCTWEAGQEALALDMRPFFREVHRTNMHKIKKGTLRDDGKLLKPADWKPPRIKEMLMNLETGIDAECDRKHPGADKAPFLKGGYICRDCWGFIVDWEES